MRAKARRATGLGALGYGVLALAGGLLVRSAVRLRPARLAVWARALVPSLISTALTLANRALPGPGGIGAMALPGHKSTSDVSPSWITALSDGKAHRYNES